MKHSSIRIPIYGIVLNICLVLIGSLIISSCATFPVEINNPPSPKPVKYIFPNILDDMNKIMLADNRASIEFLEDMVKQDVERGSKQFH